MTFKSYVPVLKKGIYLIINEIKIHSERKILQLSSFKHIFFLNYNELNYKNVSKMIFHGRETDNVVKELVLGFEN